MEYSLNVTQKPLQLETALKFCVLFVFLDQQHHVESEENYYEQPADHPDGDRSCWWHIAWNSD